MDIHRDLSQSEENKCTLTHSKVKLTHCDLREEHRLRAFEKRILRPIFGPKREWRSLHHEDLHSLHCSPNIFSMIKSRRLRWAGHVARVIEGRGAFKILTGKHTIQGRGLKEDLRIEGRIILKWILRK